MKHAQTTKTKGRAAGLLALLLAAGFLLVLPGCQAPVGPQAGRTGSLSVTIDGLAGRTIMPETGWSDDLENFRLVFAPRGNGGEIEREWGGNGSFTIDLAAGRWDLAISAYRAGDDVPAAMWDSREDYVDGILVSAGGSVEVDALLGPIAGGDGTGTFRWDMTFPADVYKVGIGIAGLGFDFSKDLEFSGDDFEEADGTLTLTGYEELDTGRYLVIFTLTLSGDLGHMVFGEVLHVWQNLESRFEAAFAPGDFPGLLLHNILGAWDDEEWEFEAAGIKAGHFGLLGIQGVDDGDGGFVDGIVEKFNALTYAQDAPADLAGLKALIDAALISMNADEGFFAGFEPADWNQPAVAKAIEGLALNNSLLYPWYWYGGGNPTVTVTVGDVYRVEIGLPSLPEERGLTGDVTIDGYAVAGLTLTANIEDLDGYGTPTFRWYKAVYPSGDFALITYGASGTFALGGVDLGHLIKVIVTRAGYSGEAVSEPVGPVTPPLPTGVVISPVYYTFVAGIGGSRQFGHTVVPTYTLQQVEWSVTPATDGVTLVGGYLTVAATVPATTTLTITATAVGHDDVYGTATVYVVHQTAAFPITFAALSGMDPITVPYPIRLAGYQNRDIAIEDPALYEAGSIRWMIGTRRLDASGDYGETLTLDERVHGNREGVHSVTVVATDLDGVTWSQLITFTVVR